MPAACAIAATVGMSSTSRPGLPMVSAITSRVVRSDGGAEAVEIARLDERGRDAEARQRVGEEIDAAAIERGRRDDMVAGAEQRRDGKMHRRHAARRAHRADAVFERRQPLFQHRRRRIGNARVDVAGALQVEQAGGMIGIVEHIRGGLIDRHRARARDRIGMLPGMQAQGLERGRFRRGHAFLVRNRKMRQNGSTELMTCQSVSARKHYKP